MLRTRTAIGSALAAGPFPCSSTSPAKLRDRLLGWRSFMAYRVRQFAMVAEVKVAVGR